MTRIELDCLCGKKAAIEYEGEDSEKFLLTHDLPTCKDYNDVTDLDTGADYIRACRLGMERMRRN